MNLIILSASFFPFPTGATYSAIRLARNLRKQGINISFLVNDQGQEWQDGGIYDGFKVRSFALYRSGKLRKLGALFRFTCYIWKQRHNFDIFHISGGGHVNIFLGWWTKMITRRKVSLKITLDEWDTPDAVAKDKWGRFIGYCYHRLDGVIAMTSGQADKCRRFGYSGELAVIPNGVDTQMYKVPSHEEQAQARSLLGLSPVDILLIYIGYIGRRKGIDILLTAWHKLQQKYGNISLLLVGDYMNTSDARKSLLSDFANQEGIPPDAVDSTRLIHMGRVENVAMYLQAADIFMFPSRQEGFGTVQIEAMACGLPCVVNDLSGISQDIFPTEAVGFRIQNNKVEDYIRIASSLIDHPEERTRIGYAARRQVEENFSSEIVATKYVNFMELLLSSRTPVRTAS